MFCCISLFALAVLLVVDAILLLLEDTNDAEVLVFCGISSILRKRNSVSKALSFSLVVDAILPLCGDFEDAKVLLFRSLNAFALIVLLVVDVDEAEVHDAEVLVHGSISSFVIMDPLVVDVDEAEVLLLKVSSRSSFHDFLSWTVLSLALLVGHTSWITSLHMLSLVGGDVLGDVDGDDSHGSLAGCAVSSSEGGPSNVQFGHQKLM